jgi:hypothetical protein
MPTVNNVCLELEQTLSKLEDRCHKIIGEMTKFDSYVASYAIERLTSRLRILEGWIIAWAEHLYEEHDKQGYVCVFFNVIKGITIKWVEDAELVADKAWNAKFGNTVLSVEESVNMIENNLVYLAQGDWERVIEWVKLYGKSPGLDFDKYR